MRLTNRQRQVAELAAQDLSLREIADNLEPRATTRTVESHVAAIADKIRSSGYRFQRGGLRLIRRWWHEMHAA
jgi:DNA-binding NarL/FixJ family response regulator